MANAEARPARYTGYELFTPGTEAEQRRDPNVSPLFAGLTGVPPARVAAGMPRRAAGNYPAAASLRVSGITAQQTKLSRQAART